MPGLRDKQRAAGSVLLLVLAAVAIMSLAVGIYLANMQSELRASRFAGRRLQTRVLAESAAEYLSAILSLDDEELEEFGGLYDNPTQLQSVEVSGRHRSLNSRAASPWSPTRPSPAGCGSGWRTSRPS